jgi:hypothetical protein
MAMPKRIQRERTKGWRMPAGAVYVGRPSRWGNPWRVGELATTEIPEDGRGPLIQFPARAITAEFAVEQYRRWMQSCHGDIREELAGKDLACWCRLDQPCRADVLLDIANK